jgi:hypothetical protein
MTEFGEQTDFGYLLVPAHASAAVTTIRSSKEGGLTDDALRKRAELYFGSQSLNKTSQQLEVANQLKEGGMSDSAVKEAMAQFGDKMAGQIEIITLCLPTPENNYRSVSIYCDGNNRFRTSGGADQVNTRATALAQACGHKDVAVMGECFIGRAHDDERVEWERLDFTEEDLSLTSAWVVQTALLNKGKNTSGWSTTGVVKNMNDKKQQQQQQNNKVKEVPVEVPEDVLPACGFWMNQDIEEIEIRIPIQKGLLTKNFLCTIKASSIVLGNKTVSKTEGSPLEGVAETLTVPSGINLCGTVDVDESTWSIAQESGGRMLTITLAKAQKKHWKSLFSA